MADLKRRLRAAESMRLPEGLWDEVVRRSDAASPGDPVTHLPQHSSGRRAVVIVVALGLVAASAGLTWRAFSPDHVQDRIGQPEPTVSASPNPLLGLPGGWSELAPPPDVRSGAVMAWTGSNLLVWGGYIRNEETGAETALGDGYTFDPVSGETTPLPPSPLSPRSFAAWAWTGSALIVWGGWDGAETFFNDGAVFEPATQQWHPMSAPPLAPRAPLFAWTGDELFVAGTSVRVDDPPTDGAMYDPAEDTWRVITPMPIELTDATAVWTGTEVIGFGSALFGGNHAATENAIGAAYDPSDDVWRRLPDSALSPQATTASWDGERLVAWDYLSQSQTFDPQTDRWSDVQRVPLDDAECDPRSLSVGPHVVGDYCGATLLRAAGSARWLNITSGNRYGWANELVAADDVALLLGRDISTGAVRTLAYRPSTPPRMEGGALIEAKVAATIAAGEFLRGVAVGDDGLWATVDNADGGPDDHVLVRIDPSTNEIVDSLPLPEAGDLAVGDGSVWVLSRAASDGAILRIDPSTDEITATIPLGDQLSNVAIGDGAVWVTRATDENPPSGEVIRIDPTTNEIVARIPIPGGWPRDLVVGEEMIWAYGHSLYRDNVWEASSLWRIDPVTNEPFVVVDREVFLGDGADLPDNLAVGGGYVWASDDSGRGLRIDAASGDISRFEVEGGFAWPFLVENGRVWFGRDEIRILDAETLVVVGGVNVETQSVDAAFDTSTASLWVANYDGTLTRIDVR